MRILLRSSGIVLFWPLSTPRDREGSYEASYCPATGVDRLLSHNIAYGIRRSVSGDPDTQASETRLVTLTLVAKDIETLPILDLFEVEGKPHDRRLGSHAGLSV